MRSATVSIDIDLVAETALVVAAKEDRIAARGIFFARVKDVLDDKIEFARRKSFDYSSCFCYTWRGNCDDSDIQDNEYT